MRYAIPLLILLSCLLLPSCKGTKSAKSNKTKVSAKKGEVKFIASETLSDVLDEAERQNKLVFVDFYTTWCLPCKLMDEEVFSDKGIAEYMNANFLSYKVNAEKGNGPNLAFLYSIKAYPTLLFLNPKGEVLEMKEGAAFHTELREMGQRALAQGGE